MAPERGAGRAALEQRTSLGSAIWCCALTAASPEQAAAAIVEGIERGRSMVYTSRDVRFGFFVQRKFALPYELAMRVLNDWLVAVTRGARG